MLITILVTSSIFSLYSKSIKFSLIFVEPMLEFPINYHKIKELNGGSVLGMGQQINGVLGEGKFNGSKKLHCQLLHRTIGGSRAYSFIDIMQVTSIKYTNNLQSRIKLYGYFGAGDFKYPRSAKRVRGFIPVLLRYNCWKKKPYMRKGKTKTPPDYIGARFYTIAEKVSAKQQPNNAGFMWTTYPYVKLHKKPNKRSKVFQSFQWVTQLYKLEKTKIKESHFIKNIDHLKGKVITDYWYKVMTPYEEVGYVFGGYLTNRFKKVSSRVRKIDVDNSPRNNYKEFPDD